MAELADGTFDQITKFLDKTTIPDIIWVTCWGFGTYSIYKMLLAAKWAAEDSAKSYEQHLDFIQKYMPLNWFMVKALDSNPITAPLAAISKAIVGPIAAGSEAISDIANKWWLSLKLPGQPAYEPTLTVQQRIFKITQDIKDLENKRAQVAATLSIMKATIASLYARLPPFPQPEFNPEELDVRAAMLKQIAHFEAQIPILEDAIKNVDTFNLGQRMLMQGLVDGVLGVDEKGDIIKLIAEAEEKEPWDVGLLATAMVLTYVILSVGGDMGSIITKLAGMAL